MLADEQAAIAPGSLLADQPQDGAAMLVAPIVDDVLHHVGVAALRHSLEEAPSLDAQAVPGGL